MPPKLDELEFHTGEGLWRTAYIGEPRVLPNTHTWFYHIRFKWVDPNHPNNKATPEHRLQLHIEREELLADDAEARLSAVIARWIDAPYADCKARFSYDSQLFLEPYNRVIE